MLHFKCFIGNTFPFGMPWRCSEHRSIRICPVVRVLLYEFSKIPNAHLNSEEFPKKVINTAIVRRMHSFDENNPPERAPTLSNENQQTKRAGPSRHTGHHVRRANLVSQLKVFSQISELHFTVAYRASCSDCFTQVGSTYRESTRLCLQLWNGVLFVKFDIPFVLMFSYEL